MALTKRDFKKIDKRFEIIDNRFDEIDKSFKVHTDKLFKRFVDLLSDYPTKEDLKNELKNYASKKDFDELQDQVARIEKFLKQEYDMQQHNLEKNTGNIKKNNKAIVLIGKHLKLSAYKQS